jgi:Flp pilus assembly protein TadG
MANPLDLIRRLNFRRKLALRFWIDPRGNVAVISAFAMIPLTLAIGMGVDYSLQKRSQHQLAGIADATALAALTPRMMASTSAVAQTEAQNFWNAQSATVSGTSNVTGTVVVSDTPNGATISRTVTVRFSGSSPTYFASLVGIASLPISGMSSAANNAAPKINFYLLVDTSPSMGIAATTSGIAIMEANTLNQGGCAFACHESNPAYDNLGNPGGVDNYALARNLGVKLRIDLVNEAVTNLMSTAAATATRNSTTYGVSVSTIDYKVSQLYQTGDISSHLSAARTAVGTLQQLEVAYNQCLILDDCNAFGAGSDQDSVLDSGISTLNTLNTRTYTTSIGPGYAMYTPGQGSGNAGDTPQEVLFIISDGVVDESIAGNRTLAPINTLIDNCTSVKARGIRIAFLYLTYNPLESNGYYLTVIKPFQPNIATAAQACASPGLYTEVSNGGDITAALNNLFTLAVQTARLTN